MMHVNPAPANFDAYRVNAADGLCALCASYENLGSAILPKLTREERENMPMPGPDACSHCGMRRVRKANR
jgi:hypothetical protein